MRVRLVALSLAASVVAFGPRPLAAAEPLPATADKTLVVWVAPANLIQQGGSALTIQSGEQFDGTRGLIAVKNATHPILRGVRDVWAPTDVYRINQLPDDAATSMYGQVLTGMKPTDPPNQEKSTMTTGRCRSSPATG